MASGMPERCTACGSAIAAARSQCTACGKVYGEHNRCPSCHAIAAVREPRRGVYACAACGAARERHRDTPLESSFADALTHGSWLRRAGAWLLGPLGLSASLLGSIVLFGGQALLSGGFETASNIFGGFFVAVGVAAMFFAYRLARVARALGLRARRERLLLHVDRAPATGVTAGQAAASLRLRVTDADATLTELAKEGRIDMHVDAAGTLRYRVPDASHASEDFDEALQEAQRGSERA